MRIFPGNLTTFEQQKNFVQKSGTDLCEPDSDANQ